jgi:hypothetical protein
MPLAPPPEYGRAVADAVCDAMIATLNAPRENLLTMSRYLIIIERTNTGLSAYSPDLPGCVATGAIREELEKEKKEMHDAIE